MTYKKNTMRKTFVKTIEKLFDEDPKVVLFLGDIGAFLLRKIKDKYPDRFFNVGISEAAMISAAAGMALDGWKPFAYTITPFITSRVFDQIRVGVGCHSANVKIVGIGSGVSYSSLGATHHSIEDIAIMRTIPGMRIFTPENAEGTEKTLREAARIDGPTYIRLTLNLPEQTENQTNNNKFADYRIARRGNSQVVIISFGETVKESLLAEERLTKKGIDPTVVGINTIKPLNKEIINIISKAKYLFTVEEHSVIGGLGSVIAELVAELPAGTKPMLTRIGIDDKYLDIYGHKQELYQYLGLDGESIYRKVLQKCKKRQK